MTRFLHWIDANKEWLFSGLGIAVLVGLWQLLLLVRRRAASRRPAGQQPASTAGWKGVTVAGRYFAWDGPNLHSLPDRSPISSAGGGDSGHQSNRRHAEL